MIVPLQILALLSAVGGLLGIPHFNWLEHWLDPVIPVHEAAGAVENSSMEWILMGVSVLGAVLGITVALQLYKNLKAPKSLAERFSALHEIMQEKWYIDEIYDAVLVRPIGKFCEFLWRFLDVQVIDRIVVSFGRVSLWSGETARVMQTGSVQIYALMLLLGLIATAGYLVYVWI
jgi:NADH-quinone oxidoreductase subunit L